MTSSRLPESKIKACRSRGRFLAAVLLLVSLGATGGCRAWSDRGDPLPESLASVAGFPGIPHARGWGDEERPFIKAWLASSEKEMAAFLSGVTDCEHRYLALSGGGAEGAFGAGLLVGWSASGTRPTFTVVTGVSTGALIAPFAFLGPAHDEQLKAVYTKYKTRDLVRWRWELSRILLNDAAFNVSRLKALIARTYDETFNEAVAEASRSGRTLLIGTMNLDAGRPVIWNISAIAMSDYPHRVQLIQRIMLASCSIPLAFPPVRFEVEAHGKTYTEIHVDGGVANQVFLYPMRVNWAELLEKLKVVGTPDVYVICNSRMEPDWKPVAPKLVAIARRSFRSLIRSQSIGDTQRIYLGTQQDGLDFHLAFIPSSYDRERNELFDREVMNELFALGYEMAKDGYPWKKVPPGFDRFLTP